MEVWINLCGEVTLSPKWYFLYVHQTECSVDRPRIDLSSVRPGRRDPSRRVIETDAHLKRRRVY
jgi:hypothetical protein